MASKIVVTGPINGQFEQLFTKLGKLHAKTAFSFALIVGDLFASPENATEVVNQDVSNLLSGTTIVPLPTYFTLGQHVLPDAVVQRIESNDGEVCANLYFLGKRSTTTTSEGVRIVTLGGTLDAQIAAGESQDRFLPFHTDSDARTLRGANTADVLLTTHWPAGVRAGSAVAWPDGVAVARAEQCVADLCTALRPRYHFSTSPEAFYEREPFAHPPTEAAPDARPVTRFISLASISAASKAKWLYAFSLDPKAPNNTPPTGTTTSPFGAPARKRAPPTSSQPSAPTNSRNPKRRKRAGPPPGPGECFFCLANPSLATHLLTSIGEHAYLSTARGPLLERTTFAALPFQSHILIIPLAHAATLAHIPDRAEAAATFAEMQRYRAALQHMVAAKSAGAYGAVTWELSRSAGVHAHWQFLPLPRKLLADGLAAAAFRVQAENAEYAALEARDAGDGSGEGDFFRVWLWIPDDTATAASGAATAGNGDAIDANPDATSTPSDAPAAKEKLQASAADAQHEPAPATPPPGTETQLVLSLAGVERFDVAFGRRVMAQLLEVPGRADWKACRQSEREEEVEAEGFKGAFKEWDFAA